MSDAEDPMLAAPDRTSEVHVATAHELSRTTPAMSDELVARAREGDRAAFEALYRENVGRVYALCMRLTADRGRAEELTQDTFVQAWRGLSTFRGESAFASWLHRIAVNASLGEHRSTKRRDSFPT